MFGRRLPAPLLLGVGSGALASLAVLPIAFATYVYVNAAERSVAGRHASSTAWLVSQFYSQGITPGTTRRIEVSGLYIRGKDGVAFQQEGPEVEPELLAAVCEAKQLEADLDGEFAMWSCVSNENADIITAVKPRSNALWRIPVLVLLLAVLVGLVGALGVFRLLAPLSRVSQALARMQAGERGVAVAPSGLAELDDLVHGLNSAARAVDNREETISQRIQIIQEMARLVAHEVRNPLQSMELLISLMESADDDEERGEFASSMRQEVQALDMVVGRLLRQGGEGMRLLRGPFRMSEIASRVTSLRRTEATSRGVRLDLTTRTHRIQEIDQALVVRSIDNLVINALQAVSDASGVIQVTVGEEDEHVFVLVEDNGPGVDASLSSHIFLPHVTGKETGTGLGLALVKGVIEAHGGYITHGRSPMGGAQFCMYIPFVPPT